jgi:propane 2-monooxygenase small subunit
VSVTTDANHTVGTTKEQHSRDVPRIEFTDAEAGALTFPSSESRTYNYFTPQKQRASVYEEVTCDVQPDPERYLTQGWLYAFANGEAGYPKDWTQLKSSDWHAFRDPNQEWEQTIYRNNANVVRQIQLNIDNAKLQKAFAAWNKQWTLVVSRHVGAWMHAEHGLGMHLFVPAQRDAPTNMINNAIAVNSMHKLRFAQDLALYNLELSEQIPGFEGQVHKSVWMEDPIWQGVRENVERLTAIKDWAEAIFAANIVFEPLVGELFRSNFVLQVAAPNGDYVTPSIVGAGENDYERDLRYTNELFSLLVNDKAHGEANRGILQGWVDRYTPMSLKAARELQPIWSQPLVKPVKFEDSLDNSKARFGATLTALDLHAPKEASA